MPDPYHIILIKIYNNKPSIFLHARKHDKFVLSVKVLAGFTKSEAMMGKRGVPASCWKNRCRKRKSGQIKKRGRVQFDSPLAAPAGHVLKFPINDWKNSPVWCWELPVLSLPREWISSRRKGWQERICVPGCRNGTRRTAWSMKKRRNWEDNVEASRCN